MSRMNLIYSGRISILYSFSRENSTASFEFRTVFLFLLVEFKNISLFETKIDPYQNHHPKN